MPGAIFLNIGKGIIITDYNLNYTSDHWNGNAYPVDSKMIGIYQGGNLNWGGFDNSESLNASISNVDNDTIIDHPKDQKIYYKLKGWNPITETYEVWVINHDITARPSLDGGTFDPEPGRQPPNVERDVWKTPPSGNALVNIIIVGRWIE